MVEACPLCDTLWRLYAKATDNLRELVGKHGDAMGKGDHNSSELLAHEIAIAESSLRAVRRELQRHESSRHNGGQQNQKSQPKGQEQNQPR